jgi:hypothetical protein
MRGSTRATFASAMAVGLLVGAVGSAALATAGGNDWEAINATSVPLWGELHGQCGKSSTANVVIDAAHALQPTKSIRLNNDCPALANLYQWGRMCFDHHWWNLPRDQSWNSSTITFRERTVGSKPNLYVQLANDEIAGLVMTDAC